MPSLPKLLLGIVLFFGIFATSVKLAYAEIIPFENNLTSIFSWLNTWNYANTYFKFGGNNFVGIVFWETAATLSTPQTITINSWLVNQQTISCTKQLKWIYYNNQRGRRVWPLDTGNLALLSWSLLATGYGSMTINNGLFTNCTWVVNYLPLANEVYGQIDHTIGSQTWFRIIAGINYNFTGNTYSGTSFGHTLSLTWWAYTGFIFDTNWGIAELSMNPPLCQNFTSLPASLPITIARGSGMSFTCYGTNITGYVLNLYISWSSSPFSTGIIYTWNSSYTWITWAALITWDYLASCTVLWPNGVWPQCWIQIPFHVGITWADTTKPTCTSFTYTPSAWTSGNVLASCNASESVIYQQPAWTNLYTFTGNWSYIFNFRDLAWNTWSSTATVTWIDKVAPTPPTIVALSQSNLCSSFPVTLQRNVSNDTGAGLWSYIYEVYNNGGMTTGIMLSWSLLHTRTWLSLDVSSLPLWTYYMRLKAIDAANNSSVSNSINFTTSPQYCISTFTGVMIITPTIWLRNAHLDTVYRSDPIRVLGLTGSVPISISKGMLFINNGTGIGTTGVITSNDTIYIEMISSNLYDTTVTSNLNVIGLTGTFSITTKKNNCILSPAEKLVIQNIYANLKTTYSNDISKYADFLHTFQSMVQDESNLSKSCTLEYLLLLIENDFWWEGIDTSNHIAPNCKEYTIWYDTNQVAYYAPEMMNRYYFINRESLIRHLDYYNPGDCHINTYGNNLRIPDISDPMVHVAPNGKIYHLIGQYGWFSATEFIRPKYFDSLISINKYIDLNNPAQETWKHTIDAWFIPIIFAAPNGKEYKIYKTNRWYMSYKLLNVKYYLTLSELKHYIDINNPSKR